MTPRSLTKAALFTAMAVTAGALVRFGSSIVPFSLLPFVAVLAGAMLGPRLGALSMGAYVLLGLMGLPVFAAPPYGGIAYIVRPSFGFLLGFVIGAYVTGSSVRFLQVTLACHPRTPGTSTGLPKAAYIASALAGTITIYLVGAPYLWFVLDVVMRTNTGFWGALQLGVIPYLIPDGVKAIVAGWTASIVVSRIPGSSAGIR